MGNPISITTLSGSTPTWDAIYKFAKITATSNVAITLSGAGTPDGGILHFVQDGTGSRTLSINGTSITVKTAASSVTRVDWAFDGTNYTYYPYLDGVSGTETITPAAPTGGTVDDTANTFTFTLNPSYAASEHEYQIGAGSWTACSSNVISVGNVAIAIGDLKVRVSADTGRNASSNLTNASAFTVAAASFVDVNYNSATNYDPTQVWHEDPDNQWNGGSNANEPANDGMFSGGVSTLQSIASGTDVYYIATLASSANIGIQIGLDDSSTLDFYASDRAGGVQQWKYGLRANENIIAYNEEGGTVAVAEPTLPFASTSRFGIRIRNASTTPVVEAIYSTDSGGTWSVAYTFTTPYPGTTLYAKACQLLADKELLNPKIKIG
jgi:hypothetical protein